MEASNGQEMAFSSVVVRNGWIARGNMLNSAG
jgi:hypothetical protein